MRPPLAILHLVLKKKWFDMIGDHKKEEYRECTPYWARVFTESGRIKIKGKHYHPSDVVVCFSHGYSKDRPSKVFWLDGLQVREGNEEWGAEKGKQYFVLKIGGPYDP